MGQIDFVHLLQTAFELKHAANKLLVIVGTKGAGKTKIVRTVSTQMSWPVVNVGKEVSERLLSLTVRQRRLKAEEVISESAIEFEHDVEESEDVVEKFKEFLDHVTPEDFAAGDS